MSDTNPENVPAPPAFVQPELVKCTTNGCEQLVSIFARACPSCAKPDPARYHESIDPQKRTLARLQYDRSPAVVAWNKAQGELTVIRELEAKRLRQVAEYEQKYLGQVYDKAQSARGKASWGIALAIFLGIMGVSAANAKDDVAGFFLTWTLMIGVPSALVIRSSNKKMKDALEKGYHPPIVYKDFG